MSDTQSKPEAPLKEPLAAFKFYDSKHRRLSIFGRLIEDDSKLEIIVLTVSKTPERRRKSTPSELTVEFVFDVFSKKAGREKYQSILDGSFNKGKRGKKYKKSPGQRFVVDVIDGRPRYTFLKWANTRYYRVQKMKQVIVMKPVFVRGEKYIHVPKKEAVIIPLGEQNGDKGNETA